MNKKSSIPYVLLISIEEQIQEFMSEDEIIDITQAYAKSIGKDVPINDIHELEPFSSGKDILQENLECLSDDEIFDFMEQIQKISYVKNNTELNEEITDLLSYQDRINGSKESRGGIAKALAEYPPKIRQQWVKACVFFDQDDYRNSLDNVRLTVELLVKTLTKSNASLENQKSSLGTFLKAKGISKQVRNYLHNILDIYEKV